ncbi:MAG TPA: methyl-accepting chemotaxis protein [Syntrophomonas sp.]|jgi:methyl-accepting chemotaxis protein|nr:methyl-accepting chemotaxis protein [Syntrophomonas sp.]
MEFVERCLRKISVRVRLVVAFTLVLAAVTGIMGYYATEVMSEKILMAAQQKLQSDLALGRQILEERYPGDWQIIDGQLYKGPVLMEGNYEVVDRIGNLTGDTCTIFRGDTRVSTNVMKDGQRAVNTKISEEVGQVVLIQGQPYVGRAEVVGVWNEAAYEPIKDPSGNAIGIWYVGVPATPYEEAVGHFRLAMVTYSGIGIFLGFLAAFLVAYTVYMPLRRISASVDKASQGDLTQRIPANANDEPGKLAAMFNTMLEKMADLIGKTGRLINNVSKSSAQVGQLSETSAALMSNLGSQAETLMRSAAEQAQLSHHSRNTIGEMAVGIQQVAASAQEVASSVAAASKKAEEGERQIEQAVKQIEIISNNTDYTASIVEALGEKSLEIGQIVDLITNIASQTNLLALNAAIEAARAGEMGRGFAVVADEVRKLAEESGEAAQRIAQLIREIQNESDKAVGAMQEGTKEVAKGTEVISRAGDAFHYIIAAVNQVKSQIEEVSSAGQQMAAGADIAIKSVDNTAEAAQNNAQIVQGMSELAGKQMEEINQFNQSVNALNRMVADLQSAIAYFKA